MKLEFSRKMFQKKLRCRVSSKSRQVGVELVHADRDGRDEANSRFSRKALTTRTSQSLR